MTVERQYLGVYGIILKGDALLLIKKSRGPYKGRWDLPGGGLHHGEGLKVALVREIMEETGVIAKDADVYMNLSHLEEYNEEGKENSFHHIGIIYFVGEYDDTGFKSEKHEDVTQASWVSLEKLSEKNCSPFLWRIILNIIG
ncbi:MAG: NUDIX domain-containing protein [Chlamydiales bacterium]|nr:NUDIX domain-containing protein [Chlamydiia bacterium]MCP5508429.1 NUDIX domain-containing protein [Chlamydiales bacterium]